MSGTDAKLLDGVEALAWTPVLLVATDYDGTLAPIVSDPAQARPHREALVAVRALAAMPQTHVAVISGRALSDLARLTGEPDEVHLVGSHGSEFDPDFAASLSPQAADLRDRIERELAEISARGNGFRVERKPASIAFHYRDADESQAQDAVKAVMSGPAAQEGVFTKQGKKVVELGVVSTNKGTALETIRHRVGASAALFIGDDATDEDAFETLSGPDVGVKVGQGQSRAKFRVEDPREVARLLARLCELRQAWLAGSEAVPIEQHSLLSDQRTLALVTPTARITWLCAPRIDSEAIFAELVGGPTAGFFAVEPASDGEDPVLLQEYSGESLTLRTRWKSLTVTDYLDCSDGRTMQRAGRVDLVRVLQGSGTARITFAPRLEFGRTATRLREHEDGLIVEGSLDPIVLRAPGVKWRIQREGSHETGIGEVDVGDGPVVLELRYGTGNLRPSADGEHHRRRQTGGVWAKWAAQLKVPDVRLRGGPDLLRRSAIVLKALCHGPTGAIAAAGTTSLPEHLGGVRNWDYRFCWPRDAAMAAASLVRLGSNGEALRFLDWLLEVVDRCDSPERLAPIYTVTGAELGPEGEISQLSGYGGSRPVRVGNAAARQVQLDVFGPIVDLVAVLLRRGAPLSSQHWRLVEAMVQAVRARWREKDHGIWEVRIPPEHHVHSKVMCWLTLDRAAWVSEHFLGKARDDILQLRDEVADEVLERGWCPERDSFRATYSGEQIDAAVLTIGLTGLVKPDDERFARTIEVVEEQLRRGPTVYRYLYDDGLPGREGGFNLCTCWLIEAYALVGRRDDAVALFNDYVRLAGPTGLYAEQYDPKEKRALGNHPQAYSHLGLINAALAVAENGNGTP